MADERVRASPATVVDLTDLLACHEHHRVAPSVKACLTARGWLYVRLTAGLQAVVDAGVARVQAFMEQPLDTKRATYDGVHPAFGYVTARGRQVLRALTGPFTPQFTATAASSQPELASAVAQLCNALDAVCAGLSAMLFQHLFPCGDGVSSGAPLLHTAAGPRRPRYADDDDVDEPLPPPSGYGMLDCVLYNNAPGAIDRPYQVAPHGDPGVFALSVASVGDGLQLWDPASAAWLSPPDGVAVLWCGGAANAMTKGGVNVGIHRVVAAASGAARLGCWYEVIHHAQVAAAIASHRSVLLRDLPPPGEDARGAGDDGGDSAVDMDGSTPVSVSVKTLTGKSIEVPGLTALSTVHDLKLAIQDKEGIPPSKQMLIHAGRRMYDDAPLVAYGVADGSVCHLVLQLRGSGGPLPPATVPLPPPPDGGYLVTVVTAAGERAEVRVVDAESMTVADLVSGVAPGVKTAGSGVRVVYGGVEVTDTSAAVSSLGPVHNGFVFVV